MSEEIKITREEYNHLREWKTRAELRGEKVAELGEKLDAANATVAELREELQECGERIKQEEARANGVGNRIAKEKAEADCKRIRLERDRLTAELESVKRERDEAQRKAMQYRKDFENANHQAQQFYAAGLTLDTDLATARQALETERAAVAALRGELAQARERAEDDSDDLWLETIARIWKRHTGKPWDTRDGETREEGLTANIEALFDQYASLLTAAQGLAEACKATKEAHFSMFTQCCSNPVFNSWGEQVDVTLLNEASAKADATLSAFESETKKETEPKQ